MPRPNAAQLAYGSATVVFSTVALLLLSRTTNALGVVVISAAGLLLGVLVTTTMPATRRTTPDPVTPVPPVPQEAPRTDEIRVPAVRVGAGAETRIGSNS
ncbi:hypothetical protein Q5762_13255 [Streptomyces sp. P9(2023)]|uniref:hypothetical protein n=1 Tax=Streptomyces sp. P9(2023) TaxID=3064394 RepID=UPI0028F3FF6A|nr:hypothetical protein [Streptomyces sp. P9(2023)]MDT9689289.1 hypothetical protein [Streptomyces sp. P9(2023)]